MALPVYRRELIRTWSGFDKAIATTIPRLALRGMVSTRYVLKSQHAQNRSGRIPAVSFRFLVFISVPIQLYFEL